MLRAIAMTGALSALLLLLTLVALESSQPRTAPARTVEVRLAGPLPLLALPPANRRGGQFAIDTASVSPIALSRLLEERGAAEDTAAGIDEPNTALPADAATPVASTLIATRTATPSPVPATATPPANPGLTAPQVEALTHAFIDLQRQAAGLAPLTRDGQLDAVATRHAVDLGRTGTLSHLGSGGRTLADRLEAGGVRYGWAGENLGRAAAATAGSVRAIISGFMLSESHRANVLSAHFRSIGVALAISESTGTAILVVVFTD